MANNFLSSRILTLNGGSSSIKFAVFDGELRVLHGEIERIGRTDASLQVVNSDEVKEQQPVGANSFAEAIDSLCQWLDTRIDLGSIAVVGHRVVHGGPRHFEPELITPEVLADLRSIVPLDPNHLPAEIRLIEAFGQRLPDVPQIACFDTAFHRDLPTVAKLLPIPRRYADAGLRRFGFHGLSYSFLLEELERQAGAEVANGRVILAHLGSGASMAAVVGGKCIDTTMGLTPTGGLVMGTRTGDLDPGVMLYLARSEGLTTDQLDDVVNSDSGMLGLSGTSADVRDLLAREATDSRAAEALDVFCYQARKWIGTLAAALGGLDTLVFSGGIGEHSPPIRERICRDLGFLGLHLDASANTANAPVISSDGSRVSVRVIPTDEEQMIARIALRTLKNTTPGPSR